MKTAFKAAYQEYREFLNGEISEEEFKTSMTCRCVSGYTWDWKTSDHERLWKFFLGDWGL